MQGLVSVRGEVMGEVRRIKASKELQLKVGTGNINEASIKAAQKVIDEDKTEFAELARPQLKKLQDAINDASKSKADGQAVLQSFREPMMNLKANAGSFKYEFVGQLTGMVLMLLENLDKPDKKVIQIVDSVHKTILLALAYKMKGDGGAAGKELLAAFQVLCQKYQQAA